MPWRTPVVSSPPSTGRSVIYTTLSPCHMCTGAILLYGIPKVVIGENRTFLGAEDLLRANGVDVVVVDDQRCVEMMTGFIEARPDLWNEDIGEDLKGGGRGRWPLGSLTDEFSESGVESGSGGWVDLAVGFPEDGFPVRVVFDLPSVLMEEPVVITTEQDEIVQIGGSSISPVSDVMGMEPTFERDIRGIDSLRPDARAGDVTRLGSTGNDDRSPTLSCGHRRHIRRSGSQERRRAVSLAITGPPSNSATPVVSEFSSQCFQVGVDDDLGRSRPVLIISSGGQFDQTVGHPLRIRVEDPRFGIGWNPISPFPDRRIRPDSFPHLEDPRPCVL